MFIIAQRNFSVVLSSSAHVHVHIEQLESIQSDSVMLYMYYDEMSMLTGSCEELFG